MIRSAALVLGLLLALAGPAAAQAPALRASVTVTSDIVRIGDLVENAGPVADIPIFRAPDLGTTGAVTTERIIDAIRPHQLIDIDTRGLTEVIVRRASRAIDQQQISERIASALAGRNGLGAAHDIQVSFDGPVDTLQAEPGASGALQVVALNYDPRTSRFDVTFDLPTSQRLHRMPLRFTGSALPTVDRVAVNRPIERGEVLRAADLVVMRRPRGQGGGFADIAAAVGLAARQPLHPGQPLAAADLMKPQIVARNETVTLVYQAPGLMLTLRGQAQDAGALGDTIGVVNLESKHVVQGVISGPGRVTVSVAPTRLVENAPAPARVSSAVALQRPE
jgi:flagella basal body P-ring formation protein FlgA